MIILGFGRLKLSSKVCTDGVVYYKVIDPYLRRRMKLHKKDNSVFGTWIAIKDTIVLFFKAKP